MNIINCELEYKIPSTLGEGAFWNYKTHELFWVDIEKKKFNVYNPNTKSNKVFDTESKIGTVVPINLREVAIAIEDGIYIVDVDTGESRLFSNIEKDVKNNRLNDGKCDPLGNLWVGSMNMNGDENKGILYKVMADGLVNKMLDNISISNGIVWTKNAKTMYYVDTPTRKIKSYHYNIDDASIIEDEVVINIPENLGFPDGMAIDEHDMLWVCMWGGAAVINFNPISGEIINKVEVPALHVTSCAFGGENLDVLYITTAREGLTSEELKEYPLSGSIFKIVPGVKGCKSPFFKIE